VPQPDLAEIDRHPASESLPHHGRLGAHHIAHTAERDILELLHLVQALSEVVFHHIHVQHEVKTVPADERRVEVFQH
jgi:hypothetical protein